MYYTKVDNREATERLRCFYLQSKIAIMLVLIMDQKRTHTTSTVITALLEMSQLFEKNNVQQEPDSFIYLLFSNSSKHMYVGETVNIDVRMRQHLNMSRKTLPTLSAYKIWRTLGIGAMSVIPIPVPSSLRKAKETEIIRFFAPTTMNVKCIMKSHNAQIHKHKSLEFSKLCRPIPIVEREHKFRKIPTEKGSKNIFVKKHMTPATAGLKHKLSPTLYKTGVRPPSLSNFLILKRIVPSPPLRRYDPRG